MKTIMENWQVLLLIVVVGLGALFVFWSDYVTPVLQVFGWARGKAKDRKARKSDDDLAALQEESRK